MRRIDEVKGSVTAVAEDEAKEPKANPCNADEVNDDVAVAEDEVVADNEREEGKGDIYLPPPCHLF